MESSNDDIVPGFDKCGNKGLLVRLEKFVGAEHCLVLHLEGNLDFSNTIDFQQQVALAIGAGYINLIFHCAGIDTVSSTAVGNLVSFLRSAKGRGGDLVLLKLQPRVLESLTLLGVGNFFHVAESMEQAVPFLAPKKFSPFPCILKCPTCAKQLKATKPGRFRCPECKTTIAIDDAGRASRT